jgi:hypothetical protein
MDAIPPDKTPICSSTFVRSLNRHLATAISDASEPTCLSIEGSAQRNDKGKCQEQRRCAPFHLSLPPVVLLDVMNGLPVTYAVALASPAMWSVWGASEVATTDNTPQDSYDVRTGAAVR